MLCSGRRVMTEEVKSISATGWVLIAIAVLRAIKVIMDECKDSN